MSEVAAVLMTAIVCVTVVAIAWIGARTYSKSFEDDKDKE
jgi:hypothetical protein